MTETTLTKTIDLADLAATQNFGARLAQLAQAGDVIYLVGDLGAGKSTLARAFVQSLMGEDEEVPSPTFTLVQTYESDVAPLYHFDLYRLEKPSEAYELGIEDAFYEGISLIEWPDRLGNLAPRERLTINLTTPNNSPHARQATLTWTPSWSSRLKDL